MVARKPAWAYPKVEGSSPPERWGHSCCYYDGALYAFGGCCGGLHLGDVVALDLKSMEWRSVKTSGEHPGSRDSHSAVMVGHQMFVFGGTDGSRKVNRLHVLNLRTREWTRPAVEGTAPAPRESHTATFVGDSSIVIFGGSGEGEGNYLNDVHVLDVKSMRWSTPEVKGKNVPVPRDSHTAVAVGNMLLVYGGDCGDHYLGEVDMLDIATFTWTRLAVQGSNSPGTRAGHASVNIGTKVYVIGGVGDRTYYNDVWMIDTNARTWIKLDVAGPQPQGRFSHSAVLVECDIAVYGGCGEDERPLDEILLLQLVSDFPSELHNLPGKECNSGIKRLSGCRKGSMELNNSSIHDTNSNSNGAFKDHFGQNYKPFVDAEADSTVQNPENCNPKRRKIALFSERSEGKVEQDEHSQTISLQSSPSHSGQEPVGRNVTCGVRVPLPRASPQAFGIIVQNRPRHNEQQQQQPQPQPQPQPYTRSQSNVQPQNATVEQQFVRLPSSVQLHVRLPHQPVALPASIVSQHAPMQSFPTVVHDHNLRGHEAQSMPQQLHKPSMAAAPNLVGAEVWGVVDAAFDSGYLMTAQVNGQVFRGLLFSPAPEIVSREQNGPGLASINCNNNTAGAGGGIIVGHPQPHPSQIQTAEHNISYMNGTLVGSPVVSNIHIGTVIQPATVVRNVPVVAGRAGGEGGPNVLIRTSPPAPGQEDRCPGPAPSALCLGSAVAAAAAVPLTSEAGPRHEAEAATGGNLQYVTACPTAGGGHWVWQPVLRATGHASAQAVDGHARKDVAHLVAMPQPIGTFSSVIGVRAPPPPGQAQMQVQKGNSNDGRSPSAARSSIVQMGPPNTISDLQGITLHLGGAGPMGGPRKH